MEDELQDFRKQWKNEINFQKALQGVNYLTIESSDENKQLATTHFEKGVQFEKKGEMARAVISYRQAVKLWPDVESQYKESSSEPSSSKQPRSVPKHENKSLEDFRSQLIDKINQAGKRFIPADGTSCNLEKLPNELVNLIFLKTIEDDNDFVTLGRLSLVCSAFYLRSIDNSLWRDIHERATKTDQIIESCSQPICWRSLFRATPHVYFNGYYSCKISYIRHGELSFQDGTYMPWYTVIYFRTIKLYPDGSAYYGISPEPPAVTSVNLGPRAKRFRTSILHGKWQLVDDLLKIVVYRECQKPKRVVRNFRNRQGNGYEHGVAEARYTLEFRLKLDERKGRYMMEWLRNDYSYRMFDGYSDDVPNDVTNEQQYPPLYFYPNNNPAGIE